MNEKNSNIIHPGQRVGVFLDVQNIYHSAKNLYKARVNFNELITSLASGRSIIRSVAYVVKSETALGEESRPGARLASPEAAFFEALRKNGIELRLKELQIYPDGTKKADWDVGLAVDAIRMANFLDVIILVTGDGDFVPLVEYLKWGMGRQVEVAAFERTASGRLKEVADHFIAIENIPRVLLKIRKRGV